jgi:hypothetical protein
MALVTYSNGAPVLASSGAQREASPPLAEWLVTYDALQVARGRGHVTYYQTTGASSASGGTHICGSAWDMKWLGGPHIDAAGSAPVMDAREMGAADFPRLWSLGWPELVSEGGGGEHVHGVIRCGYNGCNNYQYQAWLDGYNGLGSLPGHAARDPLPKPAVIRTWQDGIAWAQAQIAQLTSTMTITQEEDVAIFQLLGGKGLPAYITSGSGACAKLPNDEYFTVASALVKGDTHGFNQRQMDVATDILARLRNSQATNTIIV